jgi:hypothetical protein
MLPVLVIPLIFISAIIFSGKLNEILIQIPIVNLIRLQSFRLFVEILLWALFVKNLVPVQMTFEGRNFDILSGISALLIAWLVSNNKISRSGLIAWNFLCLALLINIVAIAILSMPSPFRLFMNDPANSVVGIFPISWLPGFLVPLAYGLHFLTLKQIFIQSRQQIKAPTPIL